MKQSIVLCGLEWSCACTFKAELSNPKKNIDTHSKQLGVWKMHAGSKQREPRLSYPRAVQLSPKGSSIASTPTFRVVFLGRPKSLILYTGRCFQMLLDGRKKLAARSLADPLVVWIPTGTPSCQLWGPQHLVGSTANGEKTIRPEPRIQTNVRQVRAWHRSKSYALVVCGCANDVSHVLPPAVSVENFWIDVFLCTLFPRFPRWCALCKVSIVHFVRLGLSCNTISFVVAEMCCQTESKLTDRCTVQLTYAQTIIISVGCLSDS